MTQVVAMSKAPHQHADGLHTDLNAALQQDNITRLCVQWTMCCHMLIMLATLTRS